MSNTATIPRGEVIRRFEQRLAELAAEYNNRELAEGTTKVYHRFLYPFHFLHRKVTLYSIPGSYEGGEQPFVWYGHWRTAKITSDGRVAVWAFNAAFGGDWFFAPSSILPIELMLSVVYPEGKPVKKRWWTRVRERL